MFVNATIDGGADRGAEAEEKGINDCVDHADGAGNDASRLEFEGAAKNGVAWQDECNGRLGEGGETKDISTADGAERAGEERRQD